MPSSAPLPKVQATRGYGAEVELARQRRRLPGAARALAEQTGAVLIHPFDHADIVPGQGTVGLEILEQCPEVETVLVCTGGGGLLAGIAAAVKALKPEVAVIGVQAEGAAAYPSSLAAGQPVPLAHDDHHGRRHRGRLPRRGALRARRRTSSTRSSPSARSRCRARCCSCSSAPSWSSSPPARPQWPRCSTPRSIPVAGAGGGGAVRGQHRPAAADARHPARHGGGRPLPAVCACGCPTGPAASRRCSACSRRPRRTCSRWSMCARAPALGGRGRDRPAAWRPRAPTTAAACSPRCGPPVSRCRYRPALGGVAPDVQVCRTAPVASARRR